VASLLVTVWSPLGRGRSPGYRLVPWWRGLSPIPRLAAVGAWPVNWFPSGRRGAWPVPILPPGCRGGVAGPWSQSGRREGVAGPLVLFCTPWERGRFFSCLVALGAWQVPWTPSGRREGVAGPLVPVQPPSGRGQSPGPRLAVEGACLFPWSPPCRLGGVAGPMCSCGRRKGVLGLLAPV